MDSELRTLERKLNADPSDQVTRFRYRSMLLRAGITPSIESGDLVHIWHFNPSEYESQGSTLYPERVWRKRRFDAQATKRVTGRVVAVHPVNKESCHVMINGAVYNIQDKYLKLLEISNPI
jgi:hypothetical protein